MNNTHIVATRIIDMYFVPKKRGWTFEKICRDTDGLVLTDSCRNIYCQNGETFVSSPNTALFLVKGSTYNIECTETGVDFLINFESIGLGNRLFTRYIMDSAKLMAGISRKDILPHDIEVKQYEYMSMFYQILSKLTKSTTHPAVLNIIKPSIRYLHENYMKHGLSLAELAAQSNISVAYFRQLFYEVYKISPMKYVTELRIEKAKRMLVDGSLTGSPNVSETALACGWSSVYRFSDYFKSVTGLSPKGYIKSITEK